MSMKEYVHGIRKTADELLEIDIKFGQTAIIGFILNGFLESYRYLVINLESKIKEIGFEELSARLIDEEKRISPIQEMKGYDGSVKANVACGGFDPWNPKHIELKKRLAMDKKMMEKVGLATSCGYYGVDGYSDAFCRRNPKNPKYEWCGQIGHDDDDCFTRKYQEQRGIDPVANLATLFPADAY
jgi:hypothetical protein